MSELTERYLMWPVIWRVGFCLMLAGSLLLLLWLVLLRPQQQMLVQHQAQLAELQLQQRQLRQTMHPSVAELQRDIAALQSRPLSAPLPAEINRLLTARGPQLESWQPQSQPPELILHLSWREFVPLFTELAASAQPVPQRFSLRSGQHILIAQLWLAHDDAK